MKNIKFIKKIKFSIVKLIFMTIIVICYIPIIYTNDISIVKGLVSIATFIFLTYMIFPVNGYEVVLNKFKLYLKKIIKENPNLVVVEKELKRLESEFL